MGVGRGLIRGRERLGEPAAGNRLWWHKDDAPCLAGLGEQRDQDPPRASPGCGDQCPREVEDAWLGPIHEPRDRGLHRDHQGIEPVGWHPSPSPPADATTAHDQRA